MNAGPLMGKAITVRNIILGARATVAAIGLLAFWMPVSAEGQHNELDIPEPMVFDLVHSLGVEKGAFEANVLALFPLNDTSDREIDWAPEVEYAIADGIALEFELAFEDSDFEAWKVASQFTFGESPAKRRIHGSQFILEKFDGFDIWELTGLYLVGKEFRDDLSMLAMVGLRATTGDDVSDHEELLVNFSLFREVDHRLVFGLESDLAIDLDDDWELELYPQLHYELSEFLELQVAIGAEIDDDDTDFSAGFRFIYARPGGPQ